MSKLSQTMKMVSGSTTYQIPFYTTTGEASGYGAYGTANVGGTTCYYPLGTCVDALTGSKVKTPQKIIKSGTTYYMLTQGQRTFKSLNINSYAKNKITDYSKITSLPAANITELTDIKPTADASKAFCGCYNITTIPSAVTKSWDTSAITNIYLMFGNCWNLTSLDISNWNTSNVTDMSYLFNACEALPSIDVVNWNTAKVTNMMFTFGHLRALNSLNITKWNTSKVTNMDEMFTYCQKLTSLDLSNFNTVNVTNMLEMFYNCSSLVTLDVSNFNTAKVTNMNYMFNGCSALKYLIINSTTVKFAMKNTACGDLNATCKILVPKSSLSAYKTSANWSSKASQFDAIENYTITKNAGKITVVKK